jgi:hypothetical protein
MTPEESAGVAALLDEAADIYRTQRMQPSTRDLYLRVLSDLPCESVVRAIRDHLRESEFYPKPSELRRRAVGSPVDHEQRAWGLAERAVARVGGALSVVFEDGTAARAIATRWGSWPAFCEALDRSDHPAARNVVKAEFLSHYRLARQQAMQHDGQAMASPRLLEGADAEHNRTRAGGGEWGGKDAPIRMALGFVTLERGVETRVVEFDRERWRPKLPAPRLVALPPMPPATGRLLDAPREEEPPPKAREDFLQEMREFVQRRQIGGL